MNAKYYQFYFNGIRVTTETIHAKEISRLLVLGDLADRNASEVEKAIVMESWKNKWCKNLDKNLSDFMEGGEG